MLHALKVVGKAEIFRAFSCRDPVSRNGRCHQNAEVDFEGEKRYNTIHSPTTDPYAYLNRKFPRTSGLLCFIRAGILPEYKVDFTP
jgi:hypothetical protein